MDTSLETKIFELFDKQWALVGAGNIDNHNFMTISWGGAGTLWNKPVVTVYVKPCRYTHKFMEENEHFIVSFFDEKYREALGIMGTKSGRDCDKEKLANLTPISYKDLTIFEEAKTTLICKKIYQNDLDINQIPEHEKNKHYLKEAPHTMYIGEVIEIINK